MEVKFVIAVIIVIKSVNCQFLAYPDNPCSGVFQYFQNNGAVFGYLEFPNDLTGYYELSVNMSIAAYLTDNKNIRLELKTPASDLVNGKAVTYFIYFPIQGVLPKPTRILFNNRVYCTGPQEQLRPGSGVTNMWASTYFKVSSSSPTQKPGLQFFLQVGDPNVPENPFTLPSVNVFPSRPKPPGGIQIQQVTGVSISSERPLNLNPRPILATATPTTTTGAPFTNPPVEQCGYSSLTAQHLVLHGKDVKEGQFPWLVAIMYRQNFDYRYRCTGSLISRRHVITAGHCVQYHQALLFPVEDFLLVLGKLNIRNWASDAVIRDAENITVHPNYQQNKGDYDIAVIRLNKDVELAPNIKPVCIWQEDDALDKVVRQQGTVVGWGRDETGNQFVPEAKSVSLPIVSQSECLRSDPAFADLTSPRTFCAGRRDGTGPCTGDSGGGFYMTRNGRWTLRGVVSLALGDSGTCDPSKYFIFVDAAKLRDWILATLNK